MSASAASEDWKKLGNEAYGRQDWQQAAEHYSTALEFCQPHSPVGLACLNNRAACFLKLKKLEDAIADASEVIRQQPDNYKAIHRRMSALEALGRGAEALEDAAVALMLQPESHETRSLVWRLRGLSEEAARGEPGSAKPTAGASSGSSASSSTASAAEELKMLGNKAYGKQDYEKAIACYSKACELCQPGDPLTLMCLNNRAACHLQQRSFLEAVKDASEVIRQQPGNVKALTRRMQGLQALHRSSEALQDAAALLALEPRKPEAVELVAKLRGSQQVPDLKERLQQAEEAEEAHLRTRVEELLQTGPFAEAVPLAERCRDLCLRRVGKFHIDYALTLDLLARLFEQVSDLRRAESTWQEALEIREKVLGRTHKCFASNLSNLALIYLDMGQFARAEKLLRQVLELREELLGRTDPTFASGLNNLASVYQIMGDFGRAEKMLLEAAEIREKVLGRTHPAFAGSLNNLATLYYQMGELEKAEKPMLEAMQIREKVFGRTHPEFAQSLNNLANLYTDMGRLDEAQQPLREALEIQRKVHGETHPDFATSLNNLGSIYKQLGAGAEAQEVLTQALAITEEALGRRHPTFAKYLNNLATVKAALGDPEGLSLAEEACSIFAELLSTTLPVMAPGQRLQMIHSVDYALGIMIAFAVGLCKGDFREEARESAKMRCFKAVALRKNLLFDSEAQDSELVHLASTCKDEVVAKELRDLDSEVKAARVQLARELFEKPDPKARATLEEQLERLERRAAQKVVEVTGSLQQPVVLHSMEPSAFLLELGRLLPPNTALVEYVYDGEVKKKGEKGDDYVAFILFNSGSSIKLHLLELGSCKEIDDDVETFVSFVASGEWEVTGAQAGQRLRERLLDRVLEAIGSCPNHLFLSPDGELCRLPFVALPLSIPSTDEPWRFVLDEAYSISYLAAGRDLLRFSSMSRQQTPSTCRLFFDPFFKAELEEDCTPSTRKASLFKQLPATREEGEALQTLLEAKGIAVQSFRGEAATRRELLKTHAPSILHLATHGFYEPYVPPGGVAQDSYKRLEELRAAPEPLLRCGLAMAGAQTWQKSTDSSAMGIVTGLELRNLDLRGTKLVTLSACETGVGQVSKGQGLSCLGRVVLLAGAETAVVTAMAVADESTKDLMVFFYSRLLQEGDSPLHRARALCEAQREVRKRSYPVAYKEAGVKRVVMVKGDHPSWWAPLLLYGATGPMISPASSAAAAQSS